MNVIKIYLSEGGSVADVRSNFALYQGAYQNKLLNVFVPTSIIAQQTDAPVTTAIKIGMIYTKRSGKIAQSDAYFMRYLKKITCNGIEYALYERLLPQAFTIYAGQGENAPTLVINVVNMAEGATTPNEQSVISIITSQTASLDVMASVNLDNDPPIEPSEAEIIHGEINSLTERLNLLQSMTLRRANIPFINSYSPTVEEVWQDFQQQGYAETDVGIYMTDLAGTMWIIADSGQNVNPAYPLIRVGSISQNVIDGGAPDSEYLD